MTLALTGSSLVDLALVAVFLGALAASLRPTPAPVPVRRRRQVRRRPD
ncbi:hypothetical protein [Pararhodospirillum photometricum]|uniref:Uncharacterized protein n=1 Tax=Pararhodospirillum photometricum DSM 122 TaxID=1150469 RepID=H6SLQ1_PARPM|nr:hypothetical protein [Pararhodospirillum photometricum]CCG08916.1 unnamed protein product [Pararhodospirillum photometricum DSM 122]